MKAAAGTPRLPSEKPLLYWFKSQGWKPLPFQRALWRHYLQGQSGLLHTPTGSGKTLAAFGGPLLEALASSPSPTGRGAGVRVRRSHDDPSTPDITTSPIARASTTKEIMGVSASQARTKSTKRELKVLWITPLKALASDTVRALREPIAALGLDWQVGLRTGDASARDKRLARAGKLDVLVSTPESLS